MQLLAFVSVTVSLASVQSADLANAGEIQQVAVLQPHVKHYVHVVAAGDECDFPDNILAMCANKDFVCRMKSGQEMYAKPPSCLIYDPSTMQDNPYLFEATAVAPWDECNPAVELSRKIGDPPVCKRDFSCLCLYGAAKSCVCAPPDAVDRADGAARCVNGTACSEDKYCHYLEKGGVECGPKPYYI